MIFRNGVLHFAEPSVGCEFPLVRHWNMICEYSVVHVWVADSWVVPSQSLVVGRCSEDYLKTRLILASNHFVSLPSTSSCKIDLFACFLCTVHSDIHRITLLAADCIIICCRLLHCGLWFTTLWIVDYCFVVCGLLLCGFHTETCLKFCAACMTKSSLQ